MMLKHFLQFKDLTRDELQDELFDVLVAVEEAYEREDLAAAWEADMAFHRTYCRLSGNGRLLVLFDQLASQTVLLMRSALAGRASLGWTPPVGFHRRIAEITENPVFVAVSEALLQWLSKYHIGELRKIGREARTLDEHRHIVERIAAHDVEGAAAAMLRPFIERSPATSLSGISTKARSNICGCGSVRDGSNRVMSS